MKAAFLILLLSIQSGADSPITEKLERVKSNLKQTEMSERQVLSSLYAITQRMKDMSAKRGKLTDRVLAANGRVRQLARRVAELESKIESQRQGLSSRLKAMYKFGGKGVARMIFSTQSSVELDRNMKFLKLISERDYDLIRDFETNHKRLVTEKAKLTGEVRHLARAQGQLKRQEDQLNEQQQSKSALVAQLKIAQEKALKEIKTLRKQQSSAGVDTWEYEAAFFEKKGALRPPVDGKIKKEYGVYQDDQFQYQLSHKGLFFATPSGAEVRSVGPGRVSFAGELNGYGRTLIIDHGDNYYSVYGYLRNYKVKPGAPVVEDQQIGETGVASPLFGMGLYFEIRHFSEAIDPKPWLRASAEIKTSQGWGER